MIQLELSLMTSVESGPTQSSDFCNSKNVIITLVA